MSADEYQRLKQTFNVAFASLLREERVANYFRARGFEVLSEGDDQTRALFGISKGGKAADIVVRVSPHRAIIAEVKGRNN